MIVMPGAWRCERHRLWTNGDCPDCDADLIASHEERQDEDMSAPLTTRDALAEAIREHMDPDECPQDCDAACLADALLASGALIDATKLAEDEALVERVATMRWGADEWAENPELSDLRATFRALAAAL